MPRPRVHWGHLSGLAKRLTGRCHGLSASVRQTWRAYGLSHPNAISGSAPGTNTRP
jgi:hypothetical protein